MNTQNQKRLLLADSSAEYRQSCIGFLELEGYTVEESSTVDETQEKLELEEFDLLLVAQRIRSKEEDEEDRSGLEIADFASERGIPCIIMTDFATVRVAQMALRSDGAEPLAKDYVLKSHGPQALLNAIGLIFRDEAANLAKLVAKGLYVDLEKKLVLKNGKVIDLTKNQYLLLEELYKKNGGVSSSAELIRAIYGEEIMERIAQRDPRLLNLVDRTKANIEYKSGRHELLEAVPGRGYRLNPKLVNVRAAGTTSDKKRNMPETNLGTKIDESSTSQQDTKRLASKRPNIIEMKTDRSSSKQNVMKRKANEKLKCKRPLHVFLCHAHNDAVAVRDIYNRLIKSDVDTWLDKEKLLPGSDWEYEICRAVREADVVVVCLSKNFNQRGFRQKEVRLALDVAMEQPEGEIFIIPARLEECESLEILKKWHWVDLYEAGGYEKLFQALKARAQKVGASLK